MAGNVNETVTSLREETRRLLQDECVAHVNSSLVQMELQMEAALSNLRGALQTAVGAVTVAMADVSEKRLPDAIAAVSTQINQLGDRVTFSNKKINDLSDSVLTNITHVIDWSRNTTEALHVNISQLVDDRNASLSARIDSFAESIENKLVTLAVNMDDELATLAAVDEGVKTDIAALRTDMLGAVANATTDATLVNNL